MSKAVNNHFFIISMINGYHKSELIRFIYFFILI